MVSNGMEVVTGNRDIAHFPTVRYAGHEAVNCHTLEGCRAEVSPAVRVQGRETHTFMGMVACREGLAAGHCSVETCLQDEGFWTSGSYSWETSISRITEDSHRDCRHSNPARCQWWHCQSAGGGSRFPRCEGRPTGHV